MHLLVWLMSTRRQDVYHGDFVLFRSGGSFIFAPYSTSLPALHKPLHNAL
jgi:hypothetical protein